MKTGIMAIQDQRIDGCKKNRAARACFCGRFKWVGYDFCMRCTKLLPAGMLRPLFGSEIDIVFCDAVDHCRDYLRAAGIKAGDQGPGAGDQEK